LVVRGIEKRGLSMMGNHNSVFEPDATRAMALAFDRDSADPSMFHTMRVNAGN